MTLENFVEESFGSDVLRRLNNIATGGNNNYKGNQYEQDFATYQICKHLVTDCDKQHIYISTQEKGFVDDLCVYSTKYDFKENYQLKNSSGNAANFTTELEERFTLQRKIDNQYYGYSTTFQHLVVSCEKKCDENNTKMDHLSGVICCYYPYKISQYELIQWLPLKEHLMRLISSQDTQKLDYAYTLLKGVWLSEPTSNLAEIFDKATEIAKPSIFNQERIDLPDDIRYFCDINGININQNSYGYEFSFNGLNLNISLEGLDGLNIDEYDSPQQFLMFLLSKHC